MNKSMLHVLAVALSLLGQEMRVPALAESLNASGCLTNYGTPFCGVRGTYRLISATYAHLKSVNRMEEAEIVANAFVNSKGRHAWD